MNKPVAIVLGGTNPHVTLVRKLQERGYYTVLVDYLPNPPAKAVADMHVQESTLDKEKVLEIAREYKASLVITTNIDQANVTACYVAERLGLPHPYSYETALNVTDKSRMKRIMWEHEIPTLRYVSVGSVEEALKSGIPYPVVLKPADSNGSRGVHRCDSDEELLHHFPFASAASRNKKVIVESYLDGVEVSFYYFVQNGVPHFIDGYRRFNFKTKNEDVIQSTGVVFPADVSEAAYREMHSITARIVEAFGLRSTPLFVQAMIKDDKAFVLEFAPRIGGGLSYRVITEDCRFDLIEAAIDSFSGVEVELNIVKPDFYSGIVNIYAPGIVMGRIEGTEKVLAEGKAREFYPYRLRGAEIPGDMSSGSRAGAFLLCGKTVDEIREQVFYINENVEIYDIHGKKAMRHDIYDIWRKQS